MKIEKERSQHLSTTHYDMTKECGEKRRATQKGCQRRKTIQREGEKRAIEGEKKKVKERGKQRKKGSKEERGVCNCGTIGDHLIPDLVFLMLATLLHKELQ